ncbi:MAG: hypothetical protein M3P18_22900 [Actinomycetota bacterium]|nr:hypothetical protein [Actinomycetota bacterium]
MAFDLLQRGNELLIDRRYEERRRLLEDLDPNAAYWSTPPSNVREGRALFASTNEMGLEGVVTKRLDSRYRPGLRSRVWTKTKYFQKRNFALLGWLPPGEWRADRGCIVLGLRAEAGRRDGPRSGVGLWAGFSPRREIPFNLSRLRIPVLRRLAGA